VYFDELIIIINLMVFLKEKIYLARIFHEGMEFMDKIVKEFGVSCEKA